MNNAIHSITTNPIFARLTRKGIPLRTTVGIGAACALFSALAGVSTGFALSSNIGQWTMVTWSLVLLGLVVALTSAAVLWPVGTISGSTAASDGGLTTIPPDPTGTSFLFLVIMLGLWMANLLAAAQGTTVGLRARNATLAAVLVGIEMVALPGIVLVAVLVLLGPVIGSQIPHLLRHAAILSAGVCVLVPCLITAGVIAWAQRTARGQR